MFWVKEVAKRLCMYIMIHNTLRLQDSTLWSTS